MSTKQKLILVTSIFIIALAVTSCVPAAQTTSEPPPEQPTAVATVEPTQAVQPATGGTLNVGVSYDTSNMDHLTSGETFTAQMLIFDTLVARGPDGNYYPFLAESWEVSDDNLQWTFHLRDDVTYHDGTPFNATSAKWFYDKARDPNGQYAFSDSYSPVDDVLAPDDTTLIFKLNTPWPNILFTLSNSFSGLISPTAYEKFGEDYGTKYAVGTGPFMLEEWVPEDRTVVVRNPDYQWGPEFLDNQGPPYLDKIIFKYFPEATTRVSELETGGIDILYQVPTADLERIVSSGTYNIYTAPAWGGALYYIDLNETKPPLGDVKVRQALNYALDIEVLAKLVLGDYGEPAYGYMAPHWHCGYSDPKSIGYSYNPDKARALLAEAGWTDSDGDGIVDKDGQPFSMTLWIYTGTESQLLGEVVQSEFADVGVQVDLLQLEYGTMVDGFNANDNEMALINYGWPDSDVYNLFFPTSQIPYLNSSHIDDPHMNELLDAANKAPTLEERCQQYAEVEKYAIEQAVWAPVFWETSVTAVNKKVNNFLVTPYTESYNDITLTP
jgi:peptide/nickel transport system substrate-binding protein